MHLRTIGKALVLAMAASGIAALSVAQTAQKPPAGHSHNATNRVAFPLRQ